MSEKGVKKWVRKWGKEVSEIVSEIVSEKVRKKWVKKWVYKWVKSEWNSDLKSGWKLVKTGLPCLVLVGLNCSYIMAFERPGVGLLSTNSTVIK